MEQREFIQLVEEILEVHSGTVSLDDELRELNWDSLADITLIAEIDEKHGLVLDAQQLAACKTPADLLTLVNLATAE